MYDNQPSFGSWIGVRIVSRLFEHGFHADDSGVFLLCPGLRIPFANLPDRMHYLNASYANLFRARYKLLGTVFQDIYKSILVDEDSYALMLSACIHLNPLRAGVVKHFEEYQWSSFLDYILGQENL